MSLHLVLGRFLPSCLLHFVTSRQWAALDDNTALVLGFARIDVDLLPQEGDIEVKILELGQKSIRLGFVVRFVFRYGRWRERPISCA